MAASWLEKHRKYIEHGQAWTQAKLIFKVVSNHRHAMDRNNTQINVTDDLTSIAMPHASVAALQLEFTSRNRHLIKSMRNIQLVPGSQALA